MISAIAGMVALAAMFIMAAGHVPVVVLIVTGVTVYRLVDPGKEN